MKARDNVHSDTTIEDDTKQEKTREEDDTKQEKTREEGGPGGLTIKNDGYKEVRTASGAKSFACGDWFSQLVEGFSVDDMYHLAESSLEDATRGELHEKYDHLNIGMQRMVLGNRIRGQSNKDEAIKAGVIAFAETIREDVDSRWEKAKEDAKALAKEIEEAKALAKEKEEAKVLAKAKKGDEVLEDV